MAAQSLCAKLGIRLAIVGSSASLAFCAPITNAGSDDTTAHTAANRSGVYFDQTAAAEKVGFIVGGQTGPLFTRSGATVNVAVTGIVGLTGATTNCFESTDGSTAGLSGAATGRIRYNNGTGTWQVSTQAGAYADITAGAPALTAMDIGYGSAGNVLTGSNTLTWNNSTRAMSVSGTIATNTPALAANSPALDLGTTWNNGAVAFSALRCIVTDTASTAASLLLDFQVGVTSKFSVSKAGAITAAAYTATRIPFIGTAGLFSDSAGLTWTTAATFSSLNVTDTVSTSLAQVALSSDAGNYFDILQYGSAYVGGVIGTTGISAPGVSWHRSNGSSLVFTTETAVPIYLCPNKALGLTLTTTAATVAAALTFTVSNVTDGTSGSAGAINTLGGIGVTKAGWFGTNLTWANGVASGTVTDAATNTTTAVLTLAHASSGTVANSFGTQTLFTLHDDGATVRNAGAINVVWTTAASATRTSAIQFMTVNSAAALTSQFSVGSQGVTVPGTTTCTGGATVNGTNSLTVTQSAVAGAVRFAVSITPVAATTVTSGTESPQVKFNAHTMQWATTTPATQRECLFDQPTYSCNAVSQTITDAATIAIVGGPIAGTNVTITNKHALWAQAGYVTMPGNSGNSLRFTSPTANASVAVTITSVGPTGAQTTIQGWFICNINGTDRFVPFW